MTPTPIKVLIGLFYLLLAVFYSLGLLWFGLQIQPIIISIPMVLVIISLFVAAFFPYGSIEDRKASLVALVIGVLGIISCILLGLFWGKEGGDQESYVGYFGFTVLLLVVFVFRAYDDYKRLADK